MSDWLSTLQKAKKSCTAHGNVKIVHYNLGDGTELAEKYNTDTDVVVSRAWRRDTKLKPDAGWEVEIGDPEPSNKLNDDDKAEVYIKESSCQPFVTRRNTKYSLEWRIRNLPYPYNIYSVTADTEEKCLIVRTSNKKYFKKLKVPELDRLNLNLEQNNVTFEHKFNTLIITYQKPEELKDFEKVVLDEVKTLKPRALDNCCQPS